MGLPARGRSPAVLLSAAVAPHWLAGLAGAPPCVNASAARVCRSSPAPRWPAEPPQSSSTCPQGAQGPSCSSKPPHGPKGPPRQVRHVLRLLQIQAIMPGKTVFETDRPEVVEAPAQRVSPACNASMAVNAYSSKSTACPADCPFYAEDVTAQTYCTFACVTRLGCQFMNEAKPVADKTMGICRGCPGPCAKCTPDGTDTCLQCKPGYTLKEGACLGNQYIWTIVYIVVGLLLILIMGWFVNLCCRPISNEEGTRHGLKFRERCKLHEVDPAWEAEDLNRGSEDSRGDLGLEPASRMRRKLWPLTTNLLREDVAGEGTTLHFRFQLFVIMWGTAITLAWVVLSLFTDTALLTLGLSSVVSPRDYCIVVQLGYHSQHILSRIKGVFIISAYLFSSIASLYHAVRQHRRFVEMDAAYTTMKDFVVQCKGLPSLPGSENVEDQLRAGIEEATGQALVGVSICWDYRGCEDKIVANLQRMETWMVRRSSSMRGRPRKMSSQAVMERLADDGAEQPAQSEGLWCRLSRHLHGVETSIMHRILGHSSALSDDAEELLKGLRTSSIAFAVFNTEGARDAAVDALVEQGGAFDFKGGKVSLRPVHFEPASVIFENMPMRGIDKIYRSLLGFGVVLLALLVWTGAFYFPYARWMLTFVSARGSEPDLIHGFSFMLVVIVGNQLMYLVCRTVASRIGFAITGSLEACYMVLYSFAIIFNVIVDLSLTYHLTYIRMVAGGYRTHDGRQLEEVSTGLEVFESYVMQKDLGQQLFRYSFPATFLVPFIVEPVFLYLVPLCLMSFLVRRHEEISRFKAEELLRSTPMDLGRYADILVNVTLAVLIFLFPGGYTVLTFGGLALAHVFIYCYDHWRVLRAVPSFCISSNIVDSWASAMLSVPCGILLGCAVFKTNCHGNLPCSKDNYVFARCAVAFSTHVIVHLLLLAILVRCLRRKKDHASKSSFKECSQNCAWSWFTTNPVHCLRSTYIYKHDPPCGFCIMGKEHLMQVNEEIGQYFETEAA